jgi:glycosyltransferase involved in cell wall biosynthesis
MSRSVRVAMVGLIAAGQGGIPRYAARLTSAIDVVAREFPGLEIELLAHPAALERMDLSQGGVAAVRSLNRVQARGGPRRIAAEQAAAALAPADLLHFFDMTFPVFAPRRRFLATMHDAAIAHSFMGERTRHKRVLQPGAGRRAERLIAVSAFAAAEAVAHLGADAARISVIHSGPGLAVPDNGVPAPGPSVPRRPYLLYVGNLYSHKNLPFLISCFGEAGLEHDLVLAGSWGSERATLEALITDSPARERIRIVSGASDDELNTLYRGATALLLPSRYEGFGFTALEAMSRGVPVLASDIPALAEICGDGAMLLPVGDRTAWRVAMTRVALDPRLADALCRQGRRSVTRFSWLRTARRVCAVFAEVGSAG